MLSEINGFFFITLFFLYYYKVKETIIFAITIGIVSFIFSTILFIASIRFKKTFKLYKEYYEKNVNLQEAFKN
ncbi:MAG: hypothetical protein ACK5XN_13460, partial [Bacteroidota bacterium]